MNKLSILLSLSILATGAVAQVGGSINRNAPKASSSLTYKNGAMMKVTYTAIRFGKGQWKNYLTNTKMHDRFNKMASGKPIGSIETTVALMASNKKIPAGKYDLYFTVSERSGWILNMRSKANAEKVLMWRLVMKDKESKSDRFKLALEAGAKDNTANLNLAFGQKMLSVPVTMAPKEDKKG